LRAYRNNTYLLVSREGAWETLRDAAARLEVARSLAEDPERYGIPHDKKKNLQQKVATYEATVNDNIRASFTFIVYATRGGKIEAKSFRPSGYGTAQPGQEIFWHVLSNILHRVTGEALDPDYAKTEAWPAQAEETTTRAFYENIHKKTGIVLPENQSLFEQTLLEGIKRGTWILIQQDKVYAPENLPSRVVISSDSKLLLPSEAGRQEMTDQRGHLCPNCHLWPCQCGTRIGDDILRPPPPPPDQEWATFEPAPPKVQLEDLEKWTRREGIDTVTEARIKVSGTTDAATQFRNLVRLSKAGKKISTTVEIKARTYQTNLSLDATFRTDDAGLETPAAKILDDIGRWSLPEFEGTITLKAEKMPMNEIRELLKNTLKTDDPKLKLALEIKPKRER
jgi:plastocyanin